MNEDSSQFGWLGSSAAMLSRRTLLERTAVGFGSLALASMLADESSADTPSANPLAGKPSHFPARAKRIIFLLMSGGPSQVDTFDPKPLLTRDHGKPFPLRQAARAIQLNQKPAAFAVEVPAVWRERFVGQRVVPARRHACR